MKKKIALAGYPVEYFKHFADHLEICGYEVYWICARSSDARLLRKLQVHDRQILDTTEDLSFQTMPLSEAQARAAAWEIQGEPTVYDIILMDRILSKKSPDFAIRYMGHIGAVIADFLRRNNIAFVTSWRDTALQLMTMLVCKKCDIRYVIPTRVRIPQEMYMFCTSHHTGDVVEIRMSSDADRQWAQQFLKEFRSIGVKPALKRAPRNFSDAIKMLPSHVEAFSYEAKRAFADRQNDFTRYKLYHLIRMFVAEKINMAIYKAYNPATTTFPHEPFALFALHTQPESSIDVVGSFFSDQIWLVKTMARSLPATHRLYVKVHPTDVDGKRLSFYRALKQIPGVRLIDYTVSTRNLLQASDFVFALTGTIAYEAALLSKPVIALAKNFFNPLPCIRFCDTPTLLPFVVQEVLASTSKSVENGQDEVEFLARIRASSYNGEVSRFHLGQTVCLTPEDLSQIVRAYDDLFKLWKVS